MKNKRNYRTETINKPVFFYLSDMMKQLRIIDVKAIEIWNSR